MLVAGCGGWFGSKEEKGLPGKRISVLSLETSLEPDPKLSDLAVRLPRPYKNRNWAQAGGTPSHAMHHLAAPGGLGKVWEVDIGDGTDGDAQLITAPVVSNGRIYTMDIDAQVQALDAATGQMIWRVSIAPKDEDDGTLGGGLAVANGKLFITTGFAAFETADLRANEFIFKSSATNELVRINGSGVGIGTTNPVAQFAVGTAARRIEIAGTDGVIRGFNRSASWANIDFEAAGYMQFYMYI